jgi:hypothetical protein
MRMMFVHAGFLLFLVFSMNGNARSHSITKFLSTAKTDYTVAAQKDKTEALKSFPYRLPIIDDIEFRVRNTAFEAGKMRYQIRVKPKGFGETRASDALFSSQERLTDQENQLLLNSALLLRYTMTLDLLEDQTLQRRYTELIMVYEDRIKVLAKKTYTTDFDLNSVILAENELTKMKDLEIEERKEINILKREIGQYLADTGFSDLDTTGIVDVETVHETVQPNRVAIDTNNVYLNNYRLRFLVSENRYKLEKAQDRRLISFLSFSHDQDQLLDEIDSRQRGKAYDLNNAYAIELGFRLPFVTVDGREIGRRKSAFLDDKATYEQALRDLVDRMKHDVDDIQALIAEYRYLTARETEVDAQASLKKYLQMNGADPLMLLSIKEGTLQNSIRKEKVRFDILRNYIRVLDVTGQLSRKPLINYLSAAKETVSP